MHWMEWSVVVFALVVMYLHEAYGAERVRALLTSEAPGFWAAVQGELDLGPGELLDGFREWLKR